MNNPHKFFGVALFAGLMLCIVSFSYPGLPMQPQMANVEKTNGLYIYIGSTPAGEYETLGPVEGGFVVKNYKADWVVPYMAKRAFKAHPTADGLILYINKNLLSGVAIRFK